MSVINWQATCNLGAIVGTAKVEAEEAAARIAELTIQGAATAGQSVEIRYNGALIFSGRVDEAEELPGGLTKINCIDGLQQDLNAMTRAQIDSLIGSRWHSSLSDDAKQGWEYATDRQLTLFGYLIKLPGQAVQVVNWEAGALALPSQSEIIEDSVKKTTPAWRDLTNKVTLEIEYRYPTFEQAEARYTGGGISGGSSWWTNANWPPGSNRTWKLYYQRIRDNNAKKLASTYVQAHEVNKLLESTGWLAASVEAEGSDVKKWLQGVPTFSEVYSSEQEVTGEEGSGIEEIKSINTISPPVGSLQAVLVKRFQSAGIVKGEISAALNGEGSEKKQSARYQLDPLFVTDMQDQPFNAVHIYWRYQTGSLPSIDWQTDFNNFVAANTDKHIKEMLAAYRGKTITYKVACNPGLNPNGKIQKVVHELNVDGGWATTEVTGINGVMNAQPTQKQARVERKRDRAPYPNYGVGSWTISARDDPPRQPPKDFYGLIRTVDGTTTIYPRSVGRDYVLHEITNAARNSFTIPAPEYTDTGAREQAITPAVWRY